MIDTVASETRKALTEADLEALPDDGYIHELVGGELVRSPKNNYTHGDICAELLTQRLQDFFSSGTQLAWIIHPDEQFVEVCHSASARNIIGPGALLDGEQLLPGFKFPIADLFKEWEWD